MRFLFLFLSFILVPNVIYAGETEKTTHSDLKPVPSKEKTWWQLRKEKAPDLYYPHNIHMDIMEKNGDSCMLCHPFVKNTERDPDTVKAITIVANEPLEAICHECHVNNISAPPKCTLCHQDIDRIRPDDHGHNYTPLHAEAARQKQQTCNACHISLSFCTDCHFSRNRGQPASGFGLHPLGYLGSHGIDSRIDPASCGRCHTANYCSDCHRRRQ